MKYNISEDVQRLAMSRSTSQNVTLNTKKDRLYQQVSSNYLQETLSFFPRQKPHDQSKILEEKVLRELSPFQRCEYSRPSKVNVKPSDSNSLHSILKLPNVSKKDINSEPVLVSQSLNFNAFLARNGLHEIEQPKKSTKDNLEEKLNELREKSRKVHELRHRETVQKSEKCTKNDSTAEPVYELPIKIQSICNSKLFPGVENSTFSVNELTSSHIRKSILTKPVIEKSLDRSTCEVTPSKEMSHEILNKDVESSTNFFDNKLNKSLSPLPSNNINIVTFEHHSLPTESSSLSSEASSDEFQVLMRSSEQPIIVPEPLSFLRSGNLHPEHIIKKERVYSDEEYFVSSYKNSETVCVRVTALPYPSSHNSSSKNIKLRHEELGKKYTPHKCQEISFDGGKSQYKFSESVWSDKIKLFLFSVEMIRKTSDIRKSENYHFY